MRTHRKCTHETNKKTTVLARVSEILARPTVTRNWSWCSVLLVQACPARRFTSFHAAYGWCCPRDRFRILRRSSLKRSCSRLPVSPMCRQLQRRQEMQHTTFSNWQLKWSRMLCALFGPCTKVWEAICLHATRPPAGQWIGISERQRGIGGVYKDITEVSLGSIWYQRGFGENPGPEDKMLKLSSKIRLVPTLNALPTRL